jgi:hypothetical protein
MDKEIRDDSTFESSKKEWILSIPRETLEMVLKLDTQIELT